MMFEPTVSLGAILTAVIVVFGFIGGAAFHLVAFGRYTGSIDMRLNDIDKQLEQLKTNEVKLTDVMVTMAQSRTELVLLSKRIDDVQMHGSHRLAEILGNYFDRLNK